MGKDVAKIAITALVSALLTAFGAYMRLDAKASQWTHDKPFVMEKVSETSKDVKRILEEITELKVIIGRRGR